MLFRDDMKAIADQARQKTFGSCGDQADVIVSTDPAHVGYLSGYRSVLWDVDRAYRCAAVVTRDQTFLITGASDAAPALEVLRDPTCVYRYGVFYVSTSDSVDYLSALPKAESTFADALSAAIRAHVKPNFAIGIDCANEWEVEQVRALVGAKAFNVRPAIIKARSTKVPGEIDKIRRATEITESGIAKALRYAKAGVTELELSTIISTDINAGGGIPRFVVVTAGQRSALADAYATSARLATGDLLRIDVGCTVDGYWTDLARTAVVGEPDRDQRGRYQALLDGEAAQLAMARPGITAGDLFDVAVERVRQGALPNYQRSHCGHGLGIGAHEFPTLNLANRDVPIEEGMVLCVETPFYQLGWGGMMVEDIIVIREGGNDCLTRLPRELQVV